MCFTIVGCGNKKDNNEQDDVGNKVNSEIVDGQTTIENVSVALLSYSTNKFVNMCFDDTYNKSTLTPSDDGTALTLLVYTNNKEISLEQIEKITIKSVKNTAMNMSTKYYMLNNKQAYIIFTKTEGLFDAEHFAVEIKTYDKKDILIPIKKDVDTTKVSSLSEKIDKATFGDIVNINNNYYFILQSGGIGSALVGMEGETYAESLVGISFIPLQHNFAPKLTKDDFTYKFFDNDNRGSKDVKTELLINDEELMTLHQRHFNGHFAEFIVLRYTITTDETKPTSEVKDFLNYVAKNTWLKGTFEENYLYNPFNR
jgi:hypothetical protein